MNTVELLFEEYRLIQQKIDNTGAFKFRVRGWSITVISAILVAVVSHQAPSIALVGAAIIAFAFNYLEQQQEELSRALGQRAVGLERAIHRLTVESPQVGEQHAARPSIQTLLARDALKRLTTFPRIGQEMRAAASKPFRVLVRNSISFKHHVFFYFQLILIGLTTLQVIVSAHEHSVRSEGRTVYVFSGGGHVYPRLLTVDSTGTERNRR